MTAQSKRLESNLERFATAGKKRSYLENRVRPKSLLLYIFPSFKLRMALADDTYVAQT
jgi:hypothetical protein